MTTRPEHVDRLRALAGALDPALAYSLRALLDADSHAHTCQEVMGRAERAEDLVAEFRRQVDPLRRAQDAARAELELSRRACHGTVYPHSGCGPKP